MKDTPDAASVTSTAVGITFAIYKQQDGGAAIWQETQNVMPDASGQYSVILGSTTPTGLPGDLFEQEEQRWLGAQVQGQAEQARVLLVSVPYALKAREAETLSGKSISDFVLAKDVSSTRSAAATAASTGAVPTQTTSGKGNNKSAPNFAASEGPTNFSGSTADQVVSVIQSGGGHGIVATTSSVTANTKAVIGTIPGPGVAILGQATSTSAQGYGIEGTSASTIGVGVLGFATATTGSTYGLKGYANSTGGTGVRGLSTATTGFTTGISASVASPAGIAGVFNNTVGGKVLSGQNNGVEKFAVDGSGNVNSASTYQIGGSSVLGIGSATDSNLFLGVGAGASNISGSGQYNLFSGYKSGSSNTIGSFNTFSGDLAGYFNISGYFNTFSGSLAGYSNTSGSNNTFSGLEAGYGNTTGSYKTFSGTYAGFINTTGSHNTFSGYVAGYSNTTGVANTFSGNQAGLSNTTACCNTFFGNAAGFNTTGRDNTFSGNEAGYNNTTGSNNTFFGNAAGLTNITGSNNTYLGDSAGTYNGGGSNNIYIGSYGKLQTDESDTIRIGGATGGYGAQTTTYIAGIYASALGSGFAVYVDPNDQLGISVSSLRFKEHVRDMGESSSRLFQLRPVTFLYKPEYDNGERTLQYGLIAEEVAKVYPDMVAYDKDGAPYTVKYQYLAPMLLNELQKRHAVVTAQQDVIKTQQNQIQTQGQQIADLQERLARLESLIAKR